MGRNRPGYTKEYHLKNRDRISKYRSKRPFIKLATSANTWYKDNKITASDLWKIAKKQKCKCALTGEKLTSKNISIDHIISRSKGGLNIPSKIRFVLKPINIARQTMTDMEFIEMCNKVVNYSLPKPL